MALSAYFVEDPLTRIVSITIGVAAGASIVVKTVDTEIFYGRAQGSAEQSDEWFQWSEPFDAFGGSYSNSGSSSALIKEHDADPGKPVWVVSGQKENAESANGSIILYSEDGASWDLVFERYEVNDGDDRVPWVLEPTGIVWDEDEKAFFASFYTADWHQSGESGEFLETPEGEEIYRSANGRTWTLVSRNLHLTGSEDLGAVASDLAAYCKKPENQNRGGGSQKIPDGLQGFNKSTGTFIKPAGLLGFDPYNGARYEGSLVPAVTRIDDKGISTTVPVGVVDCYAVAFHNSVWIAVGGGPVGPLENPGGTFIDVSFDDGLTWASVFHSSTTYHAATVSGQGAPAA